MIPLERLWQDRNRNLVLTISGAIILGSPQWTGGRSLIWRLTFSTCSHHVCIGLPARWFVALLGVICAVLAEVFSSLPPSFARLTFETLALRCGLSSENVETGT